ncbi:hypothetical protein Mtc_1426 [Methanocella conradii HZ254]|uniref:Uncharacterized protein n=1 Tax=Methanocella conradii (strain DSM 24694 / JCM 17849 / CGMCC 1.5162 / HZ254) TaxID=1041930 RepID=H8I4K1_METCZ|nr:hypothetical protein [Methanocella conradii]AFD00180.1 hypothetical protein Mtc_1426 [Methanocella conradii HZ254]
MERTIAIIFLALAVVALPTASFACDAFIGAGINLNKQFGDTINFNLGKNIGIGDTAFGLAGLNLGVTWGVNYDLNALAGYPYGYGGLGSVTQGDLGYFLDLTVDAANGAGFNGGSWGVPLFEQGVTTTHYGQRVAEQAQINDVQVLLPYTAMLMA